MGEADWGVPWSPEATLKHQLPCWDHRAAGLGVPILTDHVLSLQGLSLRCVEGGLSIGGFRGPL